RPAVARPVGPEPAEKLGVLVPGREAGGVGGGEEPSRREPRAPDERAAEEEEERHRELHRVAGVRVGTRGDEPPRRVVREGRAPAALAELLDRGEAGHGREREELEAKARRPGGAGCRDGDPAARLPENERRRAAEEETGEGPD